GKVPGTYAVSYTVTVKNDAAGTVKNAVTATGGGSTPPTCTTCSTTHPLADPVVSVVKTSNPTPNTAVAAGETITYTLTATVADAALTSDLVLTDTLGTGLTFGAVTPGSQYTADTSAAPVLKFTLAAGKVPGTYAVSYTVTVKNDATGTVRNNVTATGGSGTPPTCTTCSTTHPLKDPAIHVMKTSSPTDGATVAPGETITFTLTATVTDAALTSDLVLTDTLGTGLTFGAVVPGSQYTADTSAAPVLKFTLPTGTVPGTYAVSYTATVDAGATGNVVNNVVATGGSPTDPVCNPCSTTHPLEPNVAVTKALTGEDGTRTGVAEPGETLTYTITLHNSGGVAATGVAITDKLDANTTFVSADNGGSHAAGVVTWNGLTVPAGGTRLLTVQAKVVDPIPQGVTQVANLAYLTGSPPPACPPSGPQCVVTPTAANLSVTKALSGESLLADGVAQPGEQLTYTITVRNFGGTATTGTIVNETVPLHTTFVGPAGTWTCTAGAPAGTACNTLVNVPPHDGTQPGVVTLTFTVKVDDPLPAGVTSVANAVALNDGTPPDCAANPGNAACVVTPTVNLGFTKTVASVTTTGPGAFRVNYAIAVVNTGGAATTYTLTDTLGFASGVVFTGNAQVSTVGGTLNPAIAGGYAPVNGTVVQLSASNVSVASGATHTYTVSVPVGVPSGIADAACVPGTPGHGFYNAAGLTGTFALETSDCAPIGTDVPLIHLVKTVTLATDVNGNHYGDVGDVLGYQFTISNPGTVPLTTVQLFDPRVQNLSCPAFTVNGAPFKVLFGDELFDSGFEPRAGGGTLLPGDSVVCTASYTLTAADVALRRVVNSATAIGSGPAGQTVSSVATAIFTQFR
ncbi:isopeptide-forming domain-containing fimbrial protein, partial [Dokdonella sp.]|uniref:DUF7927 domain-containing protein n=1 Tax=Dokdonella sp. TaxID=2291710 RepID=UPI00262040B0